MIAALKRNPALAIVFVLAVLLVAGVLTFAGPCAHEDGSHGTCYDTSLFLVGIGCVAAVAAVAALVVRVRFASGALSVVAALAGALAALAPGSLLPLCMMATMRCWTVMRPFAMACGIAIFVCGVVGAVRAFKERGKASRA
ncbi:MAG: DUF4418 family protein [Eggerthellaceae bacterium]|nr:DUF4418 family protein [Eggerthellaceae bacterium]